VTPYIK
jgi:hypothetical protein